MVRELAGQLGSIRADGLEHRANARVQLGSFVRAELLVQDVAYEKVHEAIAKRSTRVGHQDVRTESFVESVEREAERLLDHLRQHAGRELAADDGTGAQRRKRSWREGRALLLDRLAGGPW